MPFGATNAIATQNLLSKLAEQSPHIVGLARDPSGQRQL